MTKAAFGKINIWDILKGAGLAALTSILTALMAFLNSGVFPTTWADWKAPVFAAVGVFVAYLIKNLFTNSEGQFKAEPK